MAVNKNESNLDKEIDVLEKTEPIQPESGDKQALQLPREGKVKRFLKTRKGKVIAILLSLIVVVSVLLAIPATRYGILGNFIKKNVTITVTDAVTNKPVSQAVVEVAGLEAKTDGAGRATLGNVPVGEYTMTVSKKYYKKTAGPYTVPILQAPGDLEAKLTATGRQVAVRVTNKITGVVLEKAKITVNDTSATTDSEGHAVIVLPADKEMLKGRAELEGFNAVDITIQVTDRPDANQITLTPSGSIAYLSKATGKINIMKSNLDGSDAKILVEGTGNESDIATSLIASRDWKYAVLAASRDTNQSKKLYLVNIQTGALSVIDEGNADFQVTGWSDHSFVYMVARPQEPWLPRAQTLKGFNADMGKLIVLDESQGSGSDSFTMQNQSITQPVLLNGLVVYGKSWSMGTAVVQPTDKKAALMSIYPDGSARKAVKDFTVNTSTFLELRRQAPKKLYLRVGSDGKQIYYEYGSGSLKEAAISEESFYRAHPWYITSPNGQKQFWSEVRNGKNTLLIGNGGGGAPTTLAEESDYAAFGWYGNEYVLLSKDDRELYIASTTGEMNPIKITDYHKPSIQYPAYRFSYGTMLY